MTSEKLAKQALTCLSKARKSLLMSDRDFWNTQARVYASLSHAAAVRDSYYDDVEESKQ